MTMKATWGAIGFIVFGYGLMLYYMGWGLW